MATITTHNLPADQQRVRSPLERLRNYIRLYVGLEGLAFVGVFLTLWFWIGLALDYLPFRVFALDWVQEVGWQLRLGLLLAVVGLLTAMVSVWLATRLLREFSDPVLAFVLERRYPRELGDRLITAVELADLDRAAQQGYSTVMVEETIHEAAERVQKLPVKEVFDWRRLWRRGCWIVVLTLGLYALVGGVFAGVDHLTSNETALGGYDGLHQVALIWFERNILLRNTIWPRKAFLELIDFPTSGELRIGSDSAPPPVRVRAWKYVVAGAPRKHAVAAYHAWLLAKGVPQATADALSHAFAESPREGWRPLTWHDLTTSLLGMPVPAHSVPPDWDARTPGAGLTLDEIEEKLDSAATHETLPAESQKGMRDVLEQLNVRVGQSGVWRTMRKLTIPAAVYLHYRGANTSSRSTLDRSEHNEFTGQFGELHESVTFTVQGEDYYTASRRIIVVPPPKLVSLLSEEERPAYLYYRPGADVKPADLRGQKQLCEPAAASLFGGDTTRVDVPSGTTVTLIARADKELRSARVLPRKGSAEIKPFPAELVDGQGFRARFNNVRHEVGFVFEFTDADGVTGQRQVLLRPSDDQPPKADVQVEVIRKTRDGYMVTPLARIPFSGSVGDDNGLGEVRFAYTIGRFDAGSPTAVKPNDLLGLLPLLAGGPTRLAAAALAMSVPQATKPSGTQYLPLARFHADLRERRDEALPLAAVRSRLAQAQKLPYRSLLRDFTVKPDEWDSAHSDPVGCDFPLWTSRLKVVDERATQPRYRLQLWLEAIDTDIDSEQNKDGSPRPHLSPSNEKFAFVVVSETELLTEIAKEEEQQHVRLEDVLNGLLTSEAKLVQVTLDLSASNVQAANLGPMSVRAEDVDQGLEKNVGTIREVLGVYQRILRELKTNVVDPKMIERVDKTIVRPLGDIESFDFPRAHDALVNFRKALDATELQLTPRLAASRAAGAQAKEQLRKLIANLNNVAGAMQKLIDINGLISMIRRIEEEEDKQFGLINQMRKKLEDDLIKGVLEPGK